MLVAGSNPVVSYSKSGKVWSDWPFFSNNGHTCALQQQQRQDSAFPTEYRVEIFSPPYLTGVSSRGRPLIITAPETITYGEEFTIQSRLKGGARIRGEIKISLMAQGFHTHGMGMGQRTVICGFKAIANSYDFTVTAPRDASVMPPGMFDTLPQSYYC